MKTLIIGGGPAGMMAAISSARNKDDVTILEKNNILGKKLLITGKGRCNITNNIDITEFINNIPSNGKFLYSAFNNFTNKDIINLLEENGLKTKVERGERVFPITDNAKDVLNIFIKILRTMNVKIRLNREVKKIIIKNKSIVGVKLSNEETLEADKVILATGGRSYSLTGSTGDGYNFAKELGHNIIKIKPALVPLEAKGDLCKKMQGLSLKNVGVKLVKNNKVIYEDFGEMLFTHFGVSGPTILSGSSYLVNYKNIEELLKLGQIKLQIDLKPGLTEEQLDLRIIRDFEELKNKQFKNSLDKLLPQKIIQPVIESSKIDVNKKVNEITKEERKKIVKILKCFELIIKDFRPVEEAIITSGGIDLKEVNPKTMESKIVNGLYFAGEILNVDALTRGI